MSAERIEAAKREAEAARRRLETTLGALQLRLRPRALATEAWDGVRGKGSDLADSALGAVKERPAAASLALGAFALFLARDPLKRAVGGMFAKGQTENGADGERADTDTNTNTDTTIRPPQSSRRRPRKEPSDDD